MRCPHARPDWRMCPHCMGLNSAREIRAHESEPPAEVSELERLRVEVVNLKGDRAELLDLAEMAWGVIANASRGHWELEHQDWQEAAKAWREKYHAAIGVETKR